MLPAPTLLDSLHALFDREPGRCTCGFAWCSDAGSASTRTPPSNPEVGPRCGACRLGLPSHNTLDPLCELPAYFKGSDAGWS